VEDIYAESSEEDSFSDLDPNEGYNPISGMLTKEKRRYQYTAA